MNTNTPYPDQSYEIEFRKWCKCGADVAKLELTFEDAIRHLEEDGSGTHRKAVQELRLLAAKTRNEQDRLALNSGFLPLTAQEIATAALNLHF